MEIEVTIRATKTRHILVRTSAVPCSRWRWLCWSHPTCSGCCLWLAWRPSVTSACPAGTLWKGSYWTVPRPPAPYWDRRPACPRYPSGRTAAWQSYWDLCFLIHPPWTRDRLFVDMIVPQSLLMEFLSKRLQSIIGSTLTACICAIFNISKSNGIQNEFLWWLHFFKMWRKSYLSNSFHYV